MKTNNNGTEFIITISLLIILAGVIFSETEASYTHPVTAQEYERAERFSACYSIYRANENYINNSYIHKSQDVVKRCATMMGLIGAYESGFYTSRRCVEDNNCFGMKSWYTGKFIKFSSRYAGKLYFAEKYLIGNKGSFRGHKNRTIEQFIATWSGDDRATELRYIDFVTSAYWAVYNSYNNSEDAENCCGRAS